MRLISTIRGTLARRGFAPRFAAAAGGAATVEFVLLFPAMAGLLAVTVLGGEGFEINRKLTMTVRTLTDLATQQTDVGLQSTTYTYSQILGAAACVMMPYATQTVQGSTVTCSSPGLSMTMSEVKSNGNGTGSVVWSEATNATALTKGATVSVPANVASGSYMILGQATYNYNPLNFFLPANAFNLSDSLYLAPRLATGGTLQVLCTNC